mmetsp:Transcript_88775/g.259454  ORF Transcript_88775/g.259454 Transcript_88775/m.259454 type:complete len:611 (-) Transcript_88775:219-2051(-)
MPRAGATRTEVLLQALMQDDAPSRNVCPSPANSETSRRREQPMLRLQPVQQLQQQQQQQQHQQQLPTSRCSSSSSTMRSSRSHAKESLQAASSALLASPPVTRRAKASLQRSSDLAFEKNARGYDKGRTPTPSDVTSMAQRHLDEDGSVSPGWSPLSAKSTSASFWGDLSDVSGSSGSLSKSMPIPSRRNAREAREEAQRQGPAREARLEAPQAGRGSPAPARSRQRSKQRTPVEEGEEGLEDACEEDVRTHRLLSKLLCRRSSVLHPMHTEGASPHVHRMPRRHSAPNWTTSPPQKGIRCLKHDEKIFDLYQWNEVLQEEGDGGKVVVCRPKGESRNEADTFVMKIRSKESLEAQHFGEQFRKSQLRMLNLTPHAGVLPLREVLEDDKFYYIVMEKANGGSLFSSLLSEFQDGVMPASAVQKLMCEILEAVSHVHKQGMLHRDIKPDNLVMQMCEGEDGRTRVKKVALIDFDHADPEWDPMSPSVRQNEFCGTVQFSAPEAFLGYFSQSSDLYSIGVILYLLMTGKMPYSDEIYQAEIHRRNEMPKRRCVWSNKTAERMQAASIDWDCNPWPEQKLCRNFCKSLLAFDPLMRPVSAEEALRHGWFASQA